MIKNRTAQLIFQTVYCTLGLVGTIASIGIFDDIHDLHRALYVQFTNLSNYLCLGVMVAALIKTIKRKGDGYVNSTPIIKFMGMLSILMTFLVFNILLAGAADRDPQLNWRIGSLCFHVVLPLMYITDWFLFYERRKMKWYYPFVATAFPLGYVAFIFIHAAIMNFDTSILIHGTNTPLIYPYFFLNLETQGVAGVAKWIVLLFVAFVAVGYIFFGLDKLGKKRTKQEEKTQYIKN